MITIYGKNNCHWCSEAKALVERYELKHEYKNVEYEKFSTEMFEKVPDAKTVPQVFWDDRHIGGYKELISEVENVLGANFGQELF